MSAKKRRITRKIARMVALDNTHHTCQTRWKRTDSERQAKAFRIYVAMVALGHAKAFKRKSSREKSITAINSNRRLRGRSDLK